MLGTHEGLAGADNCLKGRSEKDWILFSLAVFGSKDAVYHSRSSGWK